MVSAHACHYRKGAHFDEASRRIAFVFSCPGRLEERDGTPASPGGQTGRNLDLLLGRLGRTRDQILITNAWSRVEFKERTGRSEASRQEIRDPGNLGRLRRELQEASPDLVVLSGESAQAAFAALGPDLALNHLAVPHLGTRGLRSIREADLVGVDGVGFTERRLVYLAGRIAVGMA